MPGGKGTRLRIRFFSNLLRENYPTIQGSNPAKKVPIFDLAWEPQFSFENLSPLYLAYLSKYPLRFRFFLSWLPFGLPSFLPSAIALANPASVRSLLRRDSNSAIHAVIA